MKWTYTKNGYDFYASSENGDEFKITNISFFKQLRNFINWVISDIGFKYKITWQEFDYKIKPTFGGYGYKIKDPKGKTIGKISWNFDKPVKIYRTNSKADMKIIKGEDSNYIIKENNSVVGKVETSGEILNVFPIIVEIDTSEYSIDHILTFFAVLKCV